MTRRLPAVLGGLLLALGLLGPVQAATPNVGQHVHVEVASHPADGFPIPKAPWTFQVTVRLHDFPAKVQSIRIDDYSTTRATLKFDGQGGRPAAPGPCVDCAITFPWTIDFGAWKTGRHELRWHAQSSDSDPATAGTQRQFTTSRAHVCIGSCSPNLSGRATPFNGGGSWYTGVDYSTLYMLSAETQIRPGGTLVFRGQQSDMIACAYLNPNFHALDHGIPLGPNNGCYPKGSAKRTLVIPASAQVGDMLVLVAHDGFNAGVFQMRLGDGSPRPVTFYGFQSWWAKGGLVIP